MAIRESSSGVMLRVLVRPRAGSRRFIQEVTEDHIIVNLQSAPRDGKANAELLKKLAKVLRVSTASVEIVKGAKNREKVIWVGGVSVSQARNALIHDVQMW